MDALLSSTRTAGERERSQVHVFRLPIRHRRVAPPAISLCAPCCAGGPAPTLAIQLVSVQGQIAISTFAFAALCPKRGGNENDEQGERGEGR